MPEVHIAASPRTEFGKGPARRERRAGRVPAVLYGHGTQPRHISLPGHDVLLALRTANVLIRLDGLAGGSELALPKAVQRDPIKGTVEHVDLILVRSGEKVTVDIPVTVTGEVAPDGLLDQQLVQISVEAEATSDPAGRRGQRRGHGDRRVGARARPAAARGRHAGRRARPARPARDPGADRGADRGRARRRRRGRGGRRGSRGGWRGRSGGAEGAADEAPSGESSEPAGAARPGNRRAGPMRWPRRMRRSATPGHAVASERGRMRSDGRADRSRTRWAARQRPATDRALQRRPSRGASDGWWSASAILVRSTRATGTTSGSWSLTCSRPGSALGSAGTGREPRPRSGRLAGVPVDHRQANVVHERERSAGRLARRLLQDPAGQDRRRARRA